MGREVGGEGRRSPPSVFDLEIPLTSALSPQGEGEWKDLAPSHPKVARAIARDYNSPVTILRIFHAALLTPGNPDLQRGARNGS